MACCVTDCDRTGLLTRGMCKTHYARWLRHGKAGSGAINPVIKYAGTLCLVDGCPKVAKSRGWCIAHWKRWNRWGDPLGERPPRPVVEPTEADMAPGISALGLTGCIEGDCQRAIVGRGLCRKHYQAWLRRTPRDLRAPAQNLKRLTVVERYEKKRVRSGPDECWLWTGARHKSGHGEFFVSRERGRVRAHTYALELETGVPCPPGKEGCHHCDNPPCCNPAHLYYGTRQDNVDDMWRRGRGACGEAAGSAKLTEEQIVEMRVRFAAGETLLKLAADYGVSDSSVSMIANGLRWAHAGGPIVTRKRSG